MNKRELCFKIEAKNPNSFKEKEIIDILIEFAVNQNISIGGNLDGFCFCVDVNYELPVNFQDDFVNYMNNNCSKKFDKIVFE